MATTATVRINGKPYAATHFAWDDCHKIYLIETCTDRAEAVLNGYKVLPIAQLPARWEESCFLRFISTWSLAGFDDDEVHAALRWAEDEWMADRLNGVEAWLHQVNALGPLVLDAIVRLHCDVVSMLIG